MPHSPEAAAFSQSTGAESSGITLNRKTVRDLARRRDAPGLIYLATWIVALTATGALVLEAGSGIWQWLAMFAHGVVLTVPAYSFSRGFCKIPR